MANKFISLIQQELLRQLGEIQVRDTHGNELWRLLIQCTHKCTLTSLCYAIRLKSYRLRHAVCYIASVALLVCFHNDLNIMSHFLK